MTIRKVAYEVETNGDNGLPEVIDYLRVTNHAQVEWDFARERHNWPPAKDAQFLWVAYTVWAQLVKDGRFPATEPGGKVSTFKRFRESVFVDFNDVSDAAEETGPVEGAEVDPTTEADGPGGVSTSPPPPASTSTASISAPTGN